MIGEVALPKELAYNCCAKLMLPLLELETGIANGPRGCTNDLRGGSSLLLM